MTRKQFHTSILLIVIVGGLASLGALFYSFKSLSTEYDRAKAFYQQGNYQAAYDGFAVLGQYKDAAVFADDAQKKLREAEAKAEAEAHKKREYGRAVVFFEAESYEEAISVLIGLDEDMTGSIPDNYPPALSSSEAVTVAQMLTEARYRFGKHLLDIGEYERASQFFSELGEYEDSEKLYANALLHFMPEVQARVFKEALKLMDNQAYDEALVILEQLISYNYVDAVSKAEECREILNRLAAATTFSAGNVHSVAVKNDGTVVCAADSIPIDGRVNVDAWRDEDIVSVAAGGTLTLGLRRDGTVVVAGMVDSRRISAPDWQNIISVDAGNAFTVGLKADGTVVSFGHGNDGQCDVDSWTGIKAIATGVRHTAGLRTDGTVVITGYGAERQSRELAELYEEDNPIVAISAGGGWPDDPGNGHTCVLRRDGTVRVVESRNESFRLSDVEKWYNPDTDEPSRKIIAISSGDWHIVGLRTDGTVVTTYPTEEAIAEWGIKSFSSDIKDLDSWTDIVAISAGNGYTLALQDSGAVLSCGFSAGRPEDGAWTDIGIG